MRYNIEDNIHVTKCLSELQTGKTLIGLLLLYTWVKVKNFQNPELWKTPILKLAVCLLNIHTLSLKWSIVF